MSRCPSPDHPRSCGANRRPTTLRRATCGSSPLVRGQLTSRLILTVLVRIIPARAGPTYCPGCAGVATSDHPRSCGANWSYSYKGSDTPGSSPLVRGQPFCAGANIRYTRIIPARAGPTNAGFDVVFFGADHPRSCGANCVSWRVVVCTSGSSPLVRGQHLAYLLKSNEWRIIPARAGPTQPLSAQRYTSPDHPRSCGANEIIRPHTIGLVGSSPLVRGQRGTGCRDGRGERIIPARAGPTFCRCGKSILYPDHPRSCGANKRTHAARTYNDGSSPLVRGQQFPVVETVFDFRIIPARAGPTSSSLEMMASTSDHPRSCGANRPSSTASLSPFGSSPLVRGQQSDFTRKKRVESNKNI